jgi:hypothetical protein
MIGLDQTPFLFDQGAVLANSGIVGTAAEQSVQPAAADAMMSRRG